MDILGYPAKVVVSGFIGKRMQLQISDVNASLVLATDMLTVTPKPSPAR